jgi:hypothetical protein
MTKTLRIVDSHSEQCLSAGSPLVLGAGGWNIFHHFGVLKAMREHKIEVGGVLGVSAGSMTAAFHTNGYQPEDMIPVFLAMRGMRDDLSAVLEGTRLADPIAMSVGGTFSLKPFITKLIAKFNLKPNKRLKILACDYLTREPVVFEGENYDLATALTASGSPPGVFQPEWYIDNGRPRLLVDGACYHYNPTEFFDRPAFVSKFRPASAMPKEWKYPIDLYFHCRELFFPVAGNSRYVDPKRHLVIETGLPEVAGLNFGISEETCLRMVENGYNTANEIIARAKAEGRLCSA